MARIDAVIFDCDGTLVDSEPLANAVLVEYLATLGIPMTLAEAMDRYVGARMADCVADIEQRTGRRLPDTFVPELRARTSAAFRAHLHPMDGAIETLRALQLPACVASSGPPDKIELSLAVTGLTRFFPRGRVFSAYDVGRWKPDPALFLHAARALRVAPEYCAVVEDSVPGVQAGTNAAMRTFWFRPPGDVPAPVTALHKLTDLPQLLV